MVAFMRIGQIGSTVPAGTAVNVTGVPPVVNTASMFPAPPTYTARTFCGRSLELLGVIAKAAGADWVDIAVLR